MAFQPLNVVLSKSLTVKCIAIKLLPYHQLLVFLMYFSLCYKGTHKRQMRPITLNFIRSQLDTLYQLKLSHRQVEYATTRLISHGLLERRTASFKQRVGTQLLPGRQSFYRLMT